MNNGNFLFSKRTRAPPETAAALRQQRIFKSTVPIHTRRAYTRDNQVSVFLGIIYFLFHFTSSGFMAVFRQYIERDVTQYRTASLDKMFETIVKPQHVRQSPRMSAVLSIEWSIWSIYTHNNNCNVLSRENVASSAPDKRGGRECMRITYMFAHACNTCINV